MYSWHHQPQGPTKVLSASSQCAIDNYSSTSLLLLVESQHLSLTLFPHHLHLSLKIGEQVEQTEMVIIQQHIQVAHISGKGEQHILMDIQRYLCLVVCTRSVYQHVLHSSQCFFVQCVCRQLLGTCTCVFVHQHVHGSLSISECSTIILSLYTVTESHVHVVADCQWLQFFDSALQVRNVQLILCLDG